LLLSSDGYNIYNNLGYYLDGGDTLVPKNYYIAKNGFSLSTQTSIFLPMAFNKYYFITPAFSDSQYADCNANNNCFFDLLLYNIIDMNANAGAGKVINRMEPLMHHSQLTKTQMMACKHANGKDWWLLKQGGSADSNVIYKFLFTQDSVYNKGVQRFKSPAWGVWDLQGQSAFSQDGKLYASGITGKFTGEIFIANFDRCNGLVYNPNTIFAPLLKNNDPGDTTWKDVVLAGLAFSPNNKYLYVAMQYNIFQYDFGDSSWYLIKKIDTTWQEFQGYSNMYLGPDNKIYIGNSNGLSKQMSVIDSPDNKGAACSFCARCLRTDSIFYGYLVTPPCMPNYALGKDTINNCWSLSNEQLAISPNREQLKVYPNPVNSVLYIQTTSKLKRELYNYTGQLKFTTTENKIDVSKYPRGLYFVKCGADVIKVILE
jgi:hypothetical protein